MKVVAIIALCVVSAMASTSYGGAALLRSESLGYASAPLPLLRNHVPITRYLETNDGYGNYQLDYATGDGISQVEHGNLKNGAEGPVVVKDGAYSWTSPEGQHFSVSYVADEFGFRASGAHLPTPPPIPAEILPSLRGASYGHSHVVAPALPVRLSSHSSYGSPSLVRLGSY